MITQSKLITHADLKTVLDMILVGIGIFFGGLVALLGLWLWFDYQADPGRSFLAMLSANLLSTFPPILRTNLTQQAQLMGLPLTGSTPAFWYMARAGGIVAYLLLWLSTIWGLALTSKVTEGLVPGPIAYGLHEFLSLITILFALLHALVLLGDKYINFNLFHLFIPYTAPYAPFWTGLGTIAFYLIFVLTGSFYIRKQIGHKTWRALHYLTFAGYLLALGHGLMAGTDTSLGAIKLMYLGTGFSVLFLSYYRLFALKTRLLKPGQ